ncbi:MAG: NADH-quinone oxidoreductase subunit J [Planctomycetota bacterium]|jgi:NADH-quinone oxidoreductase subunit J
MENSSKIFYAALFVLVLGAHGAGLASAGAEGLAFGLFASLILGGGLVVIWERSVVRSAFALMATLIGVAGLFLLLTADFLAMAQILIYVGGVLALILFGVMLTPPDMEERQLPRVLSGLLIVGAGFTWVSMKVGDSVHFATRAADPALEGVNNAKRIGVGFLAADQYVVAFELAAVILTVALVAAVYIARRRRVDLEPAAASDLAGYDGSNGVSSNEGSA